MKDNPKNVDFEQNVFGTSPLGGNSVEAAGDGMAAIRDTSVQGVPLVYDHRVKTYISEQAQEELDDRDITLDMAKEFEQEESFRQRVGYRKSIE